MKSPSLYQRKAMTSGSETRTSSLLDAPDSNHSLVFGDLEFGLVGGRKMFGENNILESMKRFGVKKR